MFYTIRHVTKFRYSSPVTESQMEARVNPRSDGAQRCVNFQFTVSPRAHVSTYRDFLGNTVHYFDVPGRHTQLVIVSEALVDVQPPPELPAFLGDGSWAAMGEFTASNDAWEMMLPSRFAAPTALLLELAHAVALRSSGDPLQLCLHVNKALHEWFEYVPKSTRVDSPIDEALANRKGVCQDFAHIMIALLRGAGVPARYVSGYLFHRRNGSDRSSEGATHAWVEAMLPGLGWVGFDPTNNTLAGDRHIRTAVGRDYSDVPPTKGVFKGDASSELSVSVRVSESELPPPVEEELLAAQETREFVAQEDLLHYEEQQQQQQ
jgi:transglutaminase-like putative cysteine protease